MQLKQLVELSARVSSDKRSNLYIQISKISKEIEELKAKKMTKELYEPANILTKCVLDALYTNQVTQ